MKKIALVVLALCMFFALSKVTIAGELYAVIAVPDNVALNEVKKVTYDENIKLPQNNQVTALFTLFDSSRGFLKMPFDDDENEGFFANLINSIREFLSNLFPGLSNNDDNDKSDIEEEFEDLGNNIEGFGEDVSDEFEDLFTIVNNKNLPTTLMKAINTYKQNGFTTVILKVNK
jgi:hypothetical protein